MRATVPGSGLLPSTLDARPSTRGTARFGCGGAARRHLARPSALAVVLLAGLPVVKAIEEIKALKPGQRVKIRFRAGAGGDRTATHIVLPDKFAKNDKPAKEDDDKE